MSEEMNISVSEEPLAEEVMEQEDHSMDESILDYLKNDDWNIEDIQDDKIKTKMMNIGLIRQTKSGLKKSKEQNMIPKIIAKLEEKFGADKNFSADKESIQEFINMDFEKKFQLDSGKLVVFSKFSGDDFGQIIDTNGTLIAYMKYMTDTRFPWSAFEGDDRPSLLMTTIKCVPTEGHINALIKGWVVTTECSNGKIYHITSFDGLYVRDLDCIRRDINRYLIQMKNPTNKLLNNMQVRNFFNSNFEETKKFEDGNDLQIVKVYGERQAKIMMNGIEIGFPKIVTTKTALRSTFVEFVKDIGLTRSQKKAYAEWAIEFMVKPPRGGKPAELKKGKMKSLADLQSQH